MMSRWETMAANLPIIQQRLIALNELHQQGQNERKLRNVEIFSTFFIVFSAFQFSSTLSHYEAEQQALKTSLDANEQLLKQVNRLIFLLFIDFVLRFFQLKTTFQSNLDSLKTQLATIDQKLTTTTGKK